jgi:regulation of enolase protein 1 (concanavalin A-like superfamily)
MARLAAFLLLAAVQDKWAFEDKFAGKLGKGWSWIREAAGGYKIDKAALQIKPLPGTLVEKANDGKNLLVRALPTAEDGSVAVDVVVASAPGVDGEEAGILLYQDDDTWVKLARGRVEGTVRVIFARELSGVSVPLARREEPGASYRLRLRLEDRRVQAEVLPAGAAKWIIAGYCESPFAKPEAVKAALYAHGAPADAGRWATFTEFRAGLPAPVDR